MGIVYGRIARLQVWCAVIFFCATSSLPHAALGQGKPFQINGMSFPLIGSNYLDDVPGWTPIPTVIGGISSL